MQITAIVVLLGTITLSVLTATSSTIYAQIQQQPPSQNMTGGISATNTTAAAATNATTANATAATNATRIITNLTWFGGDVQQLSPENIQFQQSDPAFAKLAQTTSNCLNDYNTILETKSGATMTAEEIQGQDLCTDVIRQGIDHFCESTDFASFDIAKCEEARNTSDTYVQVVEVIFG